MAKGGATDTGRKESGEGRGERETEEEYHSSEVGQQDERRNEDDDDDDDNDWYDHDHDHEDHYRGIRGGEEGKGGRTQSENTTPRFTLLFLSSPPYFHPSRSLFRGVHLAVPFALPLPWRGTMRGKVCDRRKKMDRCHYGVQGHSSCFASTSAKESRTERGNCAE